MTDAEKLTYTTALCDNDPEATEALVSTLLKEAKLAILVRRFPFGFTEDTEVETRYEGLQCKLAARYFFKRGAEGEKTHNENGINRSYDSSNEEDLLQEVTPKAKVI